MRKFSLLMITLALFFSCNAYADDETNRFGKNGLLGRFSFATTISGPDYIDEIDSGIGLGLDYMRFLGHSIYLRTGFDYYSFGESEYAYYGGYYVHDRHAFNFHLFNISAGLRYIYHKTTPMPFFEFSPGVYINSLGGNSDEPSSYKDETAAGLGFGGGVMIPFYSGGLFEFGVRYHVDFLTDTNLQFFSFTGGISYFFHSSEPGKKSTGTD